MARKTDDGRKRYAIKYKLDEHEHATWYTRAYDRDHAIERFCDHEDDGFEYGDIISVRLASETEDKPMVRGFDETSHYRAG